MRSYRRAYFFSGFVKHASLVNKVYPPKPPLDGTPAVPNGSELAYLVFYAQHRPEKLAKVGRYLQKRVLWDLSHNRKWCHPVSLATLDSLLDACPTYTPYFAARIVRILTELLNAIEAEAAGVKVAVTVVPEDDDGDDGSVPGDAGSETTPATGAVFPSTLRDLLPAVTATWIRLNTHYDGSLDTDPHFAQPFHALVERFCRMSVVPPSGSTSPKPIARKRTLLRRRRKRSLADSTTGSMHSSTASLPIARSGDPAMAKTLVGALRSMAHSPALFRSPLAATYTAHLIPVLVANVQPELDGDGDSLEDIARSRSPSASSAGGASTVDSALAAHSVTSLALAAVQRLVASAPATSGSAVLAHLCDAMDAQQVWRDAGRTDLLLSSILAAASAPAQTLLLDQLLTRTSDRDVLRALASAPFAPGCLAVSLHDVVHAVSASGDAGAPVLAHVTRTVGVSAPRDVLGAVLARGVSPSAACAVLDVVQSDLGPVTLDQVEPVIPLLGDKDAEVRAKAAAVITAAARAPGASAQRDLAARVVDALGQVNDNEEAVVKSVVAAHVDSARDWAAVVESTSASARAVIAVGLRDAVDRGAPWTEPIADLVNPDSDIGWAALSTALLGAAAAEVDDNDDPLHLAAASSEGSLQRLYKARPTIQFGPLPEITRGGNDVVPAGEEGTVDEFQAILAGKKVAVRPVSMGGEWASVRMSMLSLDAVLDRVCGDVTSDGESVQSE
ncbi:plasma membrane localization protein [Allomyces arbusculus]|nr:plasma membrane localization protein [Allomyces arbusculus]